MAESGITNLDVDGAHFAKHGVICEMCEHTASVGHCSECECYICQSCFDNHAKVKKNHLHVLQIAPERKEDDHTIHFKTCTEHTQQEVRLYCTDHKCVGCTECMAFNHKSCKNKDITAASKEFQDGGELARFLQDIQDLANIHQNCVESFASQSELLDNMDKTTTHIVQQFAKDVVSYVTDEEKLIFSIAESKKSINNDKIQKLSDDLKRIGSDISSISANVKENDMIHIFILAVEAKPKLSQIRDILTAIDCQEVIDRFTFYPCRLLQRQLSEKRPLGKLLDNSQSEQDDVDDYECKYKTGCVENEQLKQQLSSQEKIMYAQKQDNERLQQKLSTQEKLNKRFQQQLSSQEMDITRCKQQLSTQEQDNIRLEHQLSTKEQNNAKLQHQVSTQGQDNIRLQQQLSTQEQGNQWKTLQILKLERDINERITKYGFISACGHVCDADQKNENRTIKCPTCDIIFGDQPDGTLRIEETYRHSEFKFKFDKGTQSKLNWNPGKPYEGNEVTGYVYFDTKLQLMLKLAYDRKILFTINEMGKIVSNGIDIFTDKTPP